MDAIKRLRLKKGLSLAEVADRAGLHREAVARIERPGYDPRASTLVAIARALDVPVCALFKNGGHHGKATC